MKKGLIAIALLAQGFVTASYAQFVPKVAAATVNVSNSSDRCVWVTPYYSYTLIPWASLEAKWLRPGESYTIPVLPFMHHPAYIIMNGEFKIRGEFMSNRKCDHPVIADESRQFSGFGSGIDTKNQYKNMGIEITAVFYGNEPDSRGRGGRYSVSLNQRVVWTSP
jgi:hypothetical protein